MASVKGESDFCRLLHTTPPKPPPNVLPPTTVAAVAAPVPIGADGKRPSTSGARFREGPKRFRPSSARFSKTTRSFFRARSDRTRRQIAMAPAAPQGICKREQRLPGDASSASENITQTAPGNTEGLLLIPFHQFAEELLLSCLYRFDDFGIFPHLTNQDRVGAELLPTNSRIVFVESGLHSSRVTRKR